MLTTFIHIIINRTLESIILTSFASQHRIRIGTTMSLCRRDKTLQVSRWSTCRRFFLLRSHTMMSEGLRILPTGRIYQLTLIHSTSTLNTIRSLKPNDWTPIGRFAQVVVNGMDCILFLSVIDMQGRNKLFLTQSTRMRKGFGGVLLERGSERRKRGLSFTFTPLCPKWTVFQHPRLLLTER